MIEAKQYSLKPDQPIPSIFKVMIEDASRPLSPEEEKAKREFLLGRSLLKIFLKLGYGQTNQGRARPCDSRISPILLNRACPKSLDFCT